MMRAKERWPKSSHFHAMLERLIARHAFTKSRPLHANLLDVSKNVQTESKESRNTYMSG